MRLCVFTVLYASGAEYFAALLRSLCQQSDLDFELLVIDDVASWKELGTGLTLPTDLPFPSRRIPADGTVAEIRMAGLRFLRECGDFDAVLFVDCDDVMHWDRVAKSKSALSNDALIFNELILFGNSDPEYFFKDRYSDGDTVGFEDIIEFNVLGMSNTALRIEILHPTLEYLPADLVAFDWAFFAEILRRRRRARYSSRVTTFYRQHSGNTASPLATTNDHIQKAVFIKSQHYRHLAKSDDRFLRDAVAFESLRSRLENDTSFTARYCKRMRAVTPRTFRWWEIAQLWDTP